MAVILQLAIECRSSCEMARHMKRHFDGQELASGNAPRIRARVGDLGEDENGRWWVSVEVELAGCLLGHHEDTELLAYAGRQLYEKLRSSSGYRFALVGLEAYQFNDVEKLAPLLDLPVMRGLVVDEELFQQLGRPTGFVGFSDGYFWLPADYKYD